MNLLKTRFSLASRVGDFLTTGGFDAESKALLLHLIAGTGQMFSAPAQLADIGQRLVSGKSQVPRPLWVEPIRKGSIGYLGPDLQKRVTTVYNDGETTFRVIRRSPVPDYGFEQSAYLVASSTDQDEEFIIAAENAEYLLWPVLEADPPAPTKALLSVSPIWLLPCPRDISPTSLFSSRGILTEGVDFWSDDGVILLPAHPDELFPDGVLVALAARQQGTHPLEYVYAIDDLKAPTRVFAEIARGNLTVDRMLEAGAAILGLARTPQDGVLNRVRPRFDGFEYDFDYGLISATHYQHEPLIEGQWYPKGTIIGELIKGSGPVPGSDQWHRQFAWGSATPISLDNICPVKGLILPDYPVTIDAYAQTGSLIHARIWMIGSDAARAAYWAWCKAAEVTTGYTLASSISISAVGQSITANPIDTLFSAGLSRSALVFEVHLEQFSKILKDRVLNYWRREQPSGAQMFILTCP